MSRPMLIVFVIFLKYPKLVILAFLYNFTYHNGNNANFVYFKKNSINVFVLNISGYLKPVPKTFGIFSLQQGCAPSALYRTGVSLPGGFLSRGSLSRGRGVSVQRVPVQGSLSKGFLSREATLDRAPPGRNMGPQTVPSTDRQTSVKILPCPKLRLRAVKISTRVPHLNGWAPVAVS